MNKEIIRLEIIKLLVVQYNELSFDQILERAKKFTEFVEEGITPVSNLPF